MRHIRSIPPEERLIFAADYPDAGSVRRMALELGDLVQFYKLGLPLFMSGGYFELIRWLADHGKKVFVDLKFFDVPATVALAVRQLAAHPVEFATVHGNDGMMKAAAGEKKSLKILAVTALTSLDRKDMEDLGFHCSVEDLVLSRARRAVGSGCDGVVASGLEIARLRREIDPSLIIVTPGIRPIDHSPDDQKRTITPRQAIASGADYIVVGRPIRDAPNPAETAAQIQAEIRKALP